MKRDDTKLFSILFAFFCASGCCSLIYQTVWVRLAFASFGIIAPVLSVVLSVFMLGLSLGSWLGGKYITAWVERTKISAAVFYGLAELIIGIGGAFVVPESFRQAATALLHAGESNSTPYLILSAGMIALSLFPWCLVLGTTFPFALAIVKEKGGSEESFSHLYLANVIGAVLGVILSAFVFIEYFGFTQTLWIAAFLNFSIAAVSIGLVRNFKKSDSAATESSAIAQEQSQQHDLKWMYILLFTTGFCSMAMEVIWTRGFTPALTNMTYSFASLLIVYLLATAMGSWMYRRDLAKNKLPRLDQLIASLVVLALFPIVLNDPFLSLGLLQGLLSLKAAAPSLVADPFWTWMTIKSVLALSSIFPLCFKLGYLTPQVIDSTSAGAPAQAGIDYAINTVGGILGPLVACYILLPTIGVKGSLILMTIPFVICYLGFSKKESNSVRIKTVSIGATLMIATAFLNRTSEVPVFEHFKVFRDHTATVIACGEGIKKELLVNGHGVTALVQDTKAMAMLPILTHEGPVKSALTICFGMGTTFRSLLAWNAEATAVELVPSVKTAFPEFWNDAQAVMTNPHGRIIIDDGRRFLARTKDKFDVVTIDVPPPFESAGVSLLFSEQFYKILKAHLNEGGVLQTFINPDGDGSRAAVTNALARSFKNVRAFRGEFGYFFLASDSPFKALDLSDAALNSIPQTGKLDFIEWEKSSDTNVDAKFKDMVTATFKKEVPLTELLKADHATTIVDDVPATEYFILRRFLKVVNPARYLGTEQSAATQK